MCTPGNVGKHCKRSHSRTKEWSELVFPLRFRGYSEEAALSALQRLSAWVALNLSRVTWSDQGCNIRNRMCSNLPYSSNLPLLLCLIELFLILFLQCCLGAGWFWDPSFAGRELNCSHLAEVRQEGEQDSFLKTSETPLPLRVMLGGMRIEQGRHTGMEWLTVTCSVPYTPSEVWVAATGNSGTSCILGMCIGDTWSWVWASRIRTKPALGRG